ncbi:serine/threonine-protein kinase AFC1 isoform X2 [Diospyros lotus]|uniref:serine/threonine-protein kinase AFC1 isoform X2 n=1 Tax=Diospyros lotus TaxID=55363 RepID=UPI002250704E|nr:serine/threonine-protein kinase AFC1 isoform X2 [Diospyros lotus]
METQTIMDFPLKNMDKRPRKRARLTWDMPPPVPPPPKKQLERKKLRKIVTVLPAIYYGQELADVTVPNYAYSSMYSRGVPRAGSPPWRPDDKDGHYVFAVGENLTPRYRILSKMGEGTFGQVLECLDNERKEIVAIKIVRSIHKYREAAMIEIDVLQKLARHDMGGTRCVQIRNWFDYRNHICIVFEKLGPSLYDFLRKNSYRSFPIDLVREFGRQLLESVAFMHDLRLIHTDLKPENVLLVSAEYVKVPDYKFITRSTKDGSYFKNLPKSSAIKLIDFGSTTFEHQDHTYVVSTRHYRAPEVILGLGWNYPCDIWSVGCILVELCVDRSSGKMIGSAEEKDGLYWFSNNKNSLSQGEALFQTHENLEHLAMMERVLGPLPQHMIIRADRRAEKYFRRGARLDWPEGATSRESMRAVWKLPRLQNLIMQHVDHSAGDLIDLLQGLLRYEPADRLKAREALRHPFFTRDMRRITDWRMIVLERSLFCT